MPIWVPGGGDAYSWRLDSIGTTRPTTPMGASVTPGNNSKGSYSSAIFSNLARDCFFLAVHINGGATATAARNILVDIGVDPAGGTSYTVLIPDLLGSCASAINASSATNSVGVWYYFPIWIKAGSTVAARASVNNATVGTVSVRCIVYGSPKYRDRVKVGTYVTAYGITAASSSGTAVTAGTTNEGAWTSLGSITKRAWWWQLGFGVNDTTMSNIGYFADLGVGDASNKFAVIDNEMIICSTSEVVGRMGTCIGCEFDAPDSGQTVYGRLQCSGTADSALSMAAYALGG